MKSNKQEVHLHHEAEKQQVNKGRGSLLTQHKVQPLLFISFSAIRITPGFDSPRTVQREILRGELSASNGCAFVKVFVLQYDNLSRTLCMNYRSRPFCGRITFDLRLLRHVSTQQLSFQKYSCKETREFTDSSL